MKLSTSRLSKKYFKELIFKNFSMEFQQGHSYAVRGPNGSGKSTLLKVLAGIVPPTSGNIDYIIDDKEVDQDHYYRHLTFISPYLELIEEFTLREFLDFHFKLKKFRRLILVAPPKFLGYMKHQLSGLECNDVVTHIAKDLTKRPPDEIYTNLSKQISNLYRKC